MRTIKIFILTVLGAFVFSIGFGIDFFEGGVNILTEDQDSVIANIDGDPLKAGVEVIGQNVNGIIKPIIISSEDAKYYTLNYVKRLVNYFIMFLATIALVYLLFHGLLAITAAGNEEKYNRGIKGIKYATISIVGIGISWMVISMVFWVVKNTL